MPRTVLAIQTADVDGLATDYTAANTDGHSINVGSKPKILEVINGSAAPITITIPVPGTYNGLAFQPIAITVPVAATPFAIKVLADSNLKQTADANTVWVNFSAVTGVTVACLDN